MPAGTWHGPALRRRVSAAVASTLLVTGVAAVAPAAVSASPGSASSGVVASVAPLTAATVVAGDHHTCALRDDGSVLCWGGNASGELGLGDTRSRSIEAGETGAGLVPVDLGAGRTATSLALGQDHTCAILDTGQVKCWGINSSGQLGLGNTANRGDGPGEMGDNLPVVDLGTGRTAVQLGAGFFGTCAVLDNGQVKCWGYGMRGELGAGAPVRFGDGPGEMGDSLPAVNLGTGRTATAIAVGDDHSCALLDNATVKCWGDGNAGRLGRGSVADIGDGPGEMGDSLPIVALGTGRTATAIAAGERHSCALLDNAQIKCWGDGGSGQLGVGDTNTRGDAPGEMGDALPTVFLPSGRTGTSISTGGIHTCATLDNLDLVCWGGNGNGQLGQGNTTNRDDNLTPGHEMGDLLPAVNLGTGRTAAQVSAGLAHTCALLDDDTVRCWGFNNDGELGLGDTVQRGDGPGEMGDALPEVKVAGNGIAGTVSSSAGGTVAGPFVAILRTSDFSLAGGTVGTGDGRYSAAVAPGSYFVYTLDPAGRHNPGFLGAPTTLVVVADQLTPANQTLTSTRGAVNGTVTETGSGTPLSGISVLALGVDGSPEAGTSTNGSGQYSRPELVAGPHSMVYLDPAGGHAPTTVNGVNVAGGGTTVVNPTMAAQATAGVGAALTGKVTETGTGTALAFMTVVVLRASDFTFVRAGLTNSTGNYAVYVPPGNYVVLFVDGSGAHRAEWFDGSTTGLAGATPVTAPGIASAGLDPTRGSVSGTVRYSGGAAVRAGWVIAIGSTGVVGGAVTANNGTYTVAGVVPGNYRLAILDQATLTLEYVADSPSYDGASAFAVGAGLNTVIDATIG